MSPTTILALALCGTAAWSSLAGGWEGVPGVVGLGWAGEGYTGYYPALSQGPIFSIFKAGSPTYGQMKAILSGLMRFPEIGSRIDQD